MKSLFSIVLTIALFGLGRAQTGFNSLIPKSTLADQFEEKRPFDLPFATDAIIDIKEIGDEALFKLNPLLSATENLKSIYEHFNSIKIDESPFDAIQPFDIESGDLLLPDLQTKDRPAMPFHIPSSPHDMPVHKPGSDIEYYLNVAIPKERG